MNFNHNTKDGMKLNHMQVSQDLLAQNNGYYYLTGRCKVHRATAPWSAGGLLNQNDMGNYKGVAAFFDDSH